MAATELARIVFAANTILERASSAIGLSKRGALALVVMTTDGKDGVMGNQRLQNRFVHYNISSEASAKKDASAAKSELLKVRFIEIRERMSNFVITDVGHSALGKMQDEMARAMDDLRLSDKEREVFREAVGLPRRPPVSAVVSTQSAALPGTQKKPASPR
jgi:hypothetical protein